VATQQFVADRVELGCGHARLEGGEHGVAYGRNHPAGGAQSVYVSLVFYGHGEILPAVRRQDNSDKRRSPWREASVASLDRC
jgi:hypothetical protein